MIGKGCSHSGLSGKIQSERARWCEWINEAFFWEVPKKLKRKECKKDVNKKTEHQAVKEKTELRTLCQRPQEKPQRRKLCLSQSDTETPVCVCVIAVTKRNGEVSILKKIKRMSLPVLLLLSLLTVQCGGCDFDLEGVKNIKRTIDSNPTGFRTVFPKDYYVEHRYTRSMLCDTDPCCVFPAAVVLLDSWHVLLRNLWDEHLNHSLIIDLKQTLDRIIRKNKNTERFQEETDLAQYTALSSSPEELLKLTSELFTRWLDIGCSPLIETCTLPTLPPSVERKDYGPSRARLLTTRAISNVEEGQPDMMIDITQPPCSCSPPSLSYSAFVWSPLLFRLYWWLLP